MKVWDMKRKQDILTHKLLQYKAWLNIHGGGETRVRSEFLRNLLPSANMGTSQANDHIGLAKQLTHQIVRFYVGLSTDTY
jgi:hypothetical protein